MTLEERSDSKRAIVSDELLAMADVGSCEFIDGRIVPMSPTGGEHGAEILSPDDHWQNNRRKIEEYFSIGVERMWLVEPNNRTVLVYRSATEMQRLPEGEIRGEGALEGLEIAVKELFED